MSEPVIPSLREYHVPYLPASVDISSLQLRDWIPGREFTIRDYVLLADVPHVCVVRHVADYEKYPNFGASTTYWRPVLASLSHYYVTGVDGAIQHYFSDNATPPVARPVGAMSYLLADFGSGAPATNALIRVRAPYPFYVKEVRGYLQTASGSEANTTISVVATGGDVITGTFAIPNQTRTSVIATAPTWADRVLADNEEVTVTVASAPGGTAARGLRVLLLGYPIV